MQKDDRFYTFLLTHSSKSKIYIRRVEISKRFLHSCAASLVLTAGIVSAGVVGLVKSDSSFLAKVDAKIKLNPDIINQQVSFSQKNPNYKEVSTINYDRPGTVNNTGGPLTLSNVESDEEEKEMTAQLRAIETTGSAANVPSMWAHLGKINNEYGFRRNPFGGRTYEFHSGLDIDGERGDMVVAPANGVVTKAGWQGGYGNLIEIDHQNGLTTRYGHLSKIEVQIGDSIGRGQLLGLVGSTGRSTGPHLHYEVRLNDKAINPRRFLPPEPLEVRQLSE